MRSCLAVTEEIYDIEKAADELILKLDASILDYSNKSGLLLCDYDYDVEQLSSILHKRLGFDIVGCTGIAMLSSHGVHEYAASLTVFAGDDCYFSSVLSEPINSENYEEYLGNAYKKAKEAFGGEKPKFIYMMAPLVHDISSTKYYEVLDRYSDGVPIIGGVAMGNLDLAIGKIFLNGRMNSNSCAMLLMGGNINIYFAVEPLSQSFYEQHIITESRGNRVKTVNNIPVAEFLAGRGIDVKDQTSMLLTLFNVKLSKDSDIVCRLFTEFDSKTGEAKCTGDLPVGTIISGALCKSADVGSSCDKLMQKLSDKIKEGKEDDCFTVLGISCSQRYSIMGADKDVEFQSMSKFLPLNRVTLTSFYCLGEWCPIFYDGKKVNNMSHALTIAFCMVW